MIPLRHTKGEVTSALDEGAEKSGRFYEKRNDGGGVKREYIFLSKSQVL